MKTKTSRKHTRSTRAKRTAHAHRAARSSRDKSIAWIRGLASPYLKGYIAEAAREDGLHGYWFFANDAPASQFRRNQVPHQAPAGKRTLGFFVGYSNQADGKYAFLRPDPPECLVFAWIDPPGSPQHQKLVSQPGSLVRKIFEYIRWLTHRPPRFVFHEAEAAAMARHTSMKAWPAGKRAHLSRNFFIETLAWLVRSGLVRKLREDGANH